MINKAVFDYPLFAMGFRVFFGLAGLSALALIAIWNAISNGSLHINNYYPVSIWHAHEMLLGYAAAVIAGFLLTAVKSWTGVNAVNQDQLAGLGFLWIYGRVAPFYADLLPNVLIAGVDLSFLLVLAYFVTKPLLQTRNYKNLIFVVFLLLMAGANALIHAQIVGLSATAQTGLNLLVALVIVMIVYISGRLLPFFTQRVFSGIICFRNPLLDVAAVAASFLVFFLYIFNVTGLLLATTAIAAMIINLWRLSAWYDRRICFVPLLWILYLGYAWVILGFGLLSLVAYSVILPSVAMHAFTVGGISVMTLGMMARVALGHTGRALKVSNLIALAFLLLNLAAFVRVVLPGILPAWYQSFVLISSYFWLGAFSLFLFYYSPILFAPRLDGEQG